MVAPTLGRELWSYQSEGVRQLHRISAKHGGALLADDMGTGKTTQALAALPDRGIAVVPTSVKYNWRDECLAVRPDLTPIVCEGLGLARFKWPDAGELVILGYNQLPEWLTPPPHKSGYPPSDKSKEAKRRRAELKKARKDYNAFMATQEQFGQSTVVIYDEAQAIKNRDASRTIRARMLSALCRHAWLLTGTPMPRGNVDDCLGILWSGHLDHVFGGYQNFIRISGIWFDDDKVKHYGEPLPEFHSSLSQVMIRRMKADVLPDLPPKRFREIVVPLDAASAEALGKLPPDIVAAIMEATTPKALEVVRTFPAFHEFSSRRRDLARARIPAMLEFLDDLESGGGRTLVFSAHREPILALQNRPGWETILGGAQKAEERQAIAARQHELTGVGLTFGSGAAGLNLASFDHVLYVDLDWDVNNVRQSQDRIHRPGQASDYVTYSYMMSDVPLDKLITRKLAAAARNITIAIDGGRIA